ncbi:prephenate dehydrogenase [Mesobacillus maritimus]|uniref:Prephenate dehydrogenase n=1 Tax=Mesobacillus maritimus TaxID=1643336 RepID=A0ABS7K2Q6_9BACI|nr:prephenate dehydrogenase [Mesobacillus maritimus]MBY0096552.1 prephenate dehydrogenase [Mesobacillus maritimus]
MEGRVFVIGLGLIGGSLALSIKAEHRKAIIIGYDINEEQARLAKMMGVIDECTSSIEEGAKEADLIIISTPVTVAEGIIELLAQIPLKCGVIVTDTGSTKTTITEKATCLYEKGVCFIGGHPMAGSHKSGITASKKILFENAFYLFTPTSAIEPEKIEVLKSWLKGTNAKFLTVSPEEHDYLTGVISHFPHVIAASLVHQAAAAEERSSLVGRLAAGGFRDITRIASSSPTMWRDILLHNRNVLLDLLLEWKDEMQRVITLLESNDGSGIFQYFDKAKKFRDGLPTKEKGAIPAFYDLFVDVPDYPGSISEITGYLAKEQINITNIRILETREDVYGVLVISFQNEDDRTRADQCIQLYTSFETSMG